MKFTRELPSNINLVRSYEKHQVRIGDRVIDRNCLFDAEHILDPWPIDSIAALTVANFESAFAWQPEIILLGTNVKQLPTRQLYTDIMRRNIGFEVMDIGAACRTYNVLVNENRRAAIGIVF